MNKLKCPCCESEKICEDDCYDISIISQEVILYKTGGCCDCGALIQWEEHYDFKKYERIENYG